MAYPSVNEQAVLKAAEQLMERTMARYDPSHDAYHGIVVTEHPLAFSLTRPAVQRVRKTAVSLAHSVATSTPNSRPDLFTVELAALLHDVLDKKYVTAAEAADPYRFFEPFFEQMATEYHVDLVSDGRAKTVARIIDNVSWTTEKKLRESGQWSEWHDNCVELHCVQDADRLDAIGAFGARVPGTVRYMRALR
jgi:uncharacterized protein